MTRQRTTLSPKQVRELRDRLGWSRSELARQLEVTERTVRAWEEGQNPCDGPPALLLALLDRRPDVLSILEAAAPDALPSAAAVEGSAEWLELQRLLGILDHPGEYGYWSAIVVEEHLDADWLEQMERALLIRPSQGNPEIRRTTEAAYRRFRLDFWQRWVRSRYGVHYDTSDIDVMPISVFNEYVRAERADAPRPPAA